LKIRPITVEYGGASFSARPEACGTGTGALALPAHWFLYDASDSCVAIVREARTTDTDDEVREWCLDWLADHGVA
jgi:hypothetical protein